MTPQPPESKTNGWNEWANHVLLEVERHSKELKEMNEKWNTMSNDLANLKGRAATWGAVAGFICSALVSVIVKWLK